MRVLPLVSIRTATDRGREVFAFEDRDFLLYTAVHDMEILLVQTGDDRAALIPNRYQQTNQIDLNGKGGALRRFWAVRRRNSGFELR